MATKYDPHEPLSNRLERETRCFMCALIPMPKDDDRRLIAKLVAVMLVSVWSVVFLGLAFEAVDTVSPPFFAAFTAIVWTLVGKLWDLELRDMLPTGGK